MIQHPTESNKDILEKRRIEAHKTIRQKKRKMEKEKIGKLEKFRYNPKEFFRHCKALKNGYKPIT